MAEHGKAPIRFGIMGCAEIARKMARAIRISPDAVLAAVASRTIIKAEQFAARNGLSENVKLYGSYGELLDDTCVDAVYMPLPTSLHAKWATMAARKGKHVLLEKPTAVDVKVLDEMLEACESNGVQFMDASMWYHHPRTAKMKELLSDSDLFGQVRAIHSSSSYHATPEFLSNDIRVKPDLDSLGALGDAGWYCIGAILWAMDHRLPTTVAALPAAVCNSAGVILSCTAALHWEEEAVAATFSCSFISHETMDLTVCGSHSTLRVEDLIIPYEEDCAGFSFSSGANFLDLHVGWSEKPREIRVDARLPQEAEMVGEFSRLVRGIRDDGGRPVGRWAQTSRATQLVVDAVRTSIDEGYKAVRM